ncbi:MAG: NUDIX hydrolase [Patescibacteria group bacterium]|nr:NUDIX hydrolase [Patescibacteria group bacterium]
MVQSKYFPDAFYRVSIKGVLVEDDQLMLVEDSESLPIEWELPGGGLDFGENFRGALAREIKEEMGLEVTKIADKPLYMYTHKRFERREMDWFWVLIMAYPIKLDYKKFIPTDSCLSIKFMTKEEMFADKDNIADQIRPLVDLFNPADFK